MGRVSQHKFSFFSFWESCPSHLCCDLQFDASYLVQSTFCRQFLSIISEHFICLDTSNSSLCPFQCCFSFLFFFFLPFNSFLVQFQLGFLLICTVFQLNHKGCEIDKINWHKYIPKCTAEELWDIAAIQHLSSDRFTFCFCTFHSSGEYLYSE